MCFFRNSLRRPAFFLLACVRGGLFLSPSPTTAKAKAGVDSRLLLLLPGWLSAGCCGRTFAEWKQLQQETGGRKSGLNDDQGEDVMRSTTSLVPWCWSRQGTELVTCDFLPYIHALVACQCSLGCSLAPGKQEGPPGGACVCRNMMLGRVCDLLI